MYIKLSPEFIAFICPLAIFRHKEIDILLVAYIFKSGCVNSRHDGCETGNIIKVPTLCKGIVSDGSHISANDQMIKRHSIIESAITNCGYAVTDDTISLEVWR